MYKSRKYIVFYKDNKDTKERFKVFNNLEDAFSYYSFKKSYCVSIYLSMYEVLI